MARAIKSWPVNSSPAFCPHQSSSPLLLVVEKTTTAVVKFWSIWVLNSLRSSSRYPFPRNEALKPIWMSTMDRKEYWCESGCWADVSSPMQLTFFAVLAAIAKTAGAYGLLLWLRAGTAILAGICSTWWAHIRLLFLLRWENVQWFLGHWSHW